MKIEISDIITNERVRKDLGDITELAADIEENGQISPIAITADNVLIAGGRRLAACTQLGWTEIEATVLEIREAEKLIQLEMAENIARKELTFSEKMSYAQKLEIIESEKARLRQEHRSEDAKSGDSRNSDEAGRTDEIVAKACGLGGKDTYRKAKLIIESGDMGVIGRVDKGEISIHKASEILKKPKQAKVERSTSTKITDTRSVGIDESENEIEKLKRQLQLERDFSNEKEMEIKDLSKELQQSKHIIKTLQKASLSDAIDTSLEVAVPEAPEVPLYTNPIEICSSFIGKVENLFYQLKQSTNKIEMSSGIRESINDCRMLLLRTVDDLRALTGDNDGISITKSDTKPKRAKKVKSKATTKSMPKKKAKDKQKTKSIKQSQTVTRKEKETVEKDKQTILKKSEIAESELQMVEGILGITPVG